MNRYELKARGQSRSELKIYGDIGQSWDAEESNDAKTVVEALGQLRGDVDVRINSFGGSVADGLAIFNALRRHDGAVTTHIDGVAYSIASLIAMAGEKVHIADNGVLMIHAPWGMAIGNAVDMRDMAEMLDKHADAMLTSYLRPGGPGADTVRGWLSDGQDHYFTAAEAVELGLADAISESAPTLQIAAALMQDQRRFHLPAASSRITPEGATMANDVTPGAETKVPSADVNSVLASHSRTVKAAIDKGVQAEAKRRDSITDVFADFYDGDPLNPVTALHDECMADTKCDELTSRRKLLAYLAQATANPVIPQDVVQPPPRAEGLQSAAKRYIQPGRDASDGMVEGITKALMVKAGIETNKDELAAAQRNEFISFEYADIARALLRAQGVTPPMGKYQLFQKAIRASGIGQTSSNFADILENIATKAALQGFEDAEETWQQWCQVGTLPDFKAASRVNLSLFGALDSLQEGQQYEYGSFSDIKEGIQAQNHGKKFSISLEALTNDDLNILSRVPTAMGAAANRTVGNAVYAILTTGAVSYRMDQDNTLLWDASTHKNYVTSGGAPAVATVSAGRTAMATQTDPSGATIGIRARYLLHPEALWATVYALLGSTEITTSNVGTVNAIRAMNLIPISDHRLDTFNTAGWFLAAASNTVEVAFVGGQRTPQLERQETTDADGIVWKVRLPFGVAATDYRGLFYNDGA